MIYGDHRAPRWRPIAPRIFNRSFSVFMIASRANIVIALHLKRAIKTTVWNG
jgi:hypothetical protein